MRAGYRQSQNKFVNWFGCFFIPDFMGISSLVSAFAEVLNAIRPESERNAREWTNHGREFDVIIGRYEFNV